MNSLESKFKPLFIGHGSPMNIIANNGYSRFLNRLGLQIGKPTAIVVISSHWVTEGTWITANESPEQIFDFYGFPADLYDCAYAPKGDPVLAAEISLECPEVQLNSFRGIDHAAWTIAKHMFPYADVPLLEISLDRKKSEREHYDLGKKLRHKFPHILFIGSGNLIHNLREISFKELEKPFDWAVEFDRWFKDKLIKRDYESLINYRECLSNFKRAIPTSDHYLPMLYVIGMLQDSESIELLFEEIQNGSISMLSFSLKEK